MKNAPIRIGFPYENYPRIFRDEKGKWSGIHVDLWKIFAESMGTTIDIAYPDVSELLFFSDYENISK